MSIRNLYLVIFLSVATLTAISITGCNKDDDNQTEYTGYAEAQARLEAAYTDLDIIFMRAYYYGSVGLKGGANPLASCASVTIDTIGALDVMTIDFGQSNCLCFDGKYRRGKLIVSYSGGYKDSTHYRRVEPNNYFINDSKVVGVKEVTSRGLDNFGRPYYGITFSGKVYYPDPQDGSVEGSGNFTMAWTNGNTTDQIQDDVLEMDGVGSLRLYNGAKFSTEILDPVVVAMDCNWIKKGVVRITPENATRRSLDYGDGACDDRAEITVNGAIREIVIGL